MHGGELVRKFFDLALLLRKGFLELRHFSLVVGSDGGTELEVVVHLGLFLHVFLAEVFQVLVDVAEVGDDGQDLLLGAVVLVL